MHNHSCYIIVSSGFVSSGFGYVKDNIEPPRLGKVDRVSMISIGNSLTLSRFSGTSKDK